MNRSSILQSVEWVAIFIAITACGSSPTEGDTDAGVTPDVAPSGECQSVQDGCTCTVQPAASTGVCDQSSTPGNLTCCASGTLGAPDYTCSCLALPYHGPWTCAGTATTECRCVADSVNTWGAPLAASQCVTQYCAWWPSQQQCVCDAFQASRPPDAVPVPSCATAPSEVRAPCSADSQSVYACDATEPPSCDPSSCDDQAVCVGGQACYHDCENSTGALGSGVGFSCVEHCNGC